MAKLNRISKRIRPFLERLGIVRRRPSLLERVADKSFAVLPGLVGYAMAPKARRVATRMTPILANAIYRINTPGIMESLVGAAGKHMIGIARATELLPSMGGSFLADRLLWQRLAKRYRRSKLMRNKLTRTLLRGALDTTGAVLARKTTGKLLDMAAKKSIRRLRPDDMRDAYRLLEQYGGMV